MRTRAAIRTLLVGLTGGLVLMAACAPAGSPPPRTAPTTEQPAAGKPAAEKPSGEKPAAGKPATGATTSVSGIPLDPNAKYGGILQEAYNAEGPTFSTWEERGAGITGIVSKMLNNPIRNQTWGTVEDWKKEAYLEYKPDLATSWEQSADGLSWTLKFRDGVKWSDGTPFTCADVKWSFDTIRTGQGLKRSVGATHWLTVKDIQCTDTLTMVISLKRPKQAFIHAIGGGNNYIRPKHIYENNTDLMRDKPPVVSTGPFLLKEWLPGEKYTFVRNNDYWDKPLPYVDGVEMKLLTTQAAVAGMRAGRVDFFYNYGIGGPEAEAIIKECNVCTVLPSPNPELAKGSPTCGWCPAVMVHHQRPPWNSPQVKEAITLAFDRKKMATIYLGWRAAIPDCGFAPGSFFAMPAERCKQIPGFNHDDPEGNKQRARELLAQAGYQPGELKLNFNLWVAYQELAPFIVEDLKGVGIEPDVKIIETARNYDIMTAGDFDVHLHGFAIPGSVDPDFIFYEHFYTGSDRNYNRYGRPEIDRLIDDMSQTLDREERRRKAWDLMETIMREQGKMPLLVITSTSAYNKRVQNWIGAGGIGNCYGPCTRLESAWVKE